MVEGRFKKWKCLHSCMSYRGRVLIINNLIASALWHKLSVLEPPVDLLIKVQIMLVDFFWGGSNALDTTEYFIFIKIIWRSRLDSFGKQESCF